MSDNKWYKAELAHYDKKTKLVDGQFKQNYGRNYQTNIWSVSQQQSVINVKKEKITHNNFKKGPKIKSEENKNREREIKPVCTSSHSFYMPKILEYAINELLLEQVKNIEPWKNRRKINY